MNERGPQVLFYLVMLVLPLTALAARHVRGRQLALMALAWVGIFAVGLLIATIADFT